MTLAHAINVVQLVSPYVTAKSKEEAMSDYITKVKQLLEEAGSSG